MSVKELRRALVIRAQGHDASYRHWRQRFTDFGGEQTRLMMHEHWARRQEAHAVIEFIDRMEDSGA